MSKANDSFLPLTNAERRRSTIFLCVNRRRAGKWCLSVFICVNLWLIFLASCSTKKTDLRALVPADSLVYLESNDIGAAVRPIIDSPEFTAAAKTKPDLSTLDGVQMAVAVTGFETTEEKLSDEQSIGRVKPHFVAVIETHAWSWEALAFTDQKLGQFVTDLYGADVTQEQYDENGGRHFTWSAVDGRKSHAFLSGSTIYFSSDPSSIERCLSVKRGEAESIAKSGRVPASEPSVLASGYVSPDGVAQVANIAGLQLASRSGEDAEVQSAMAAIVPQLLRNSLTDASWSSRLEGGRYRDDYTFGLRPGVAQLANETIQVSGNDSDELEEFVPAEAYSATQYNLNDPAAALRGVLASAKSAVAPGYSQILEAVTGVLFDPYGIEDAQAFLTSVKGGRVVTVRMDGEGDEAAVITRVASLDGIKSAVDKGLDLSKPGEPLGDGSIWRSAEGVALAAFRSNGDEIIIIGENSAVERCAVGRRGAGDAGRGARWKSFAAGFAAATVTNEVDRQAGIVSVLSEKRSADAVLRYRMTTATRFEGQTMQRRSTSPFGLIGLILAQLSEE